MLGKVVGEAHKDTPDQYWHGPGADLYVPIDVMVKDVAVPRTVVQADPDMAQSELIRMRQMGNPVMLTAPQWAALEPLYKAASAQP